MRDVCYCSKSKLIITGFKGYIGNQLIQFLQNTIINENCIIGRIEDFLLEASCVIHLGASVEPKLESFKNNLITDIEILEIINNAKIPLIYASSNNVYPFKSNCDGNDYSINDCYSASKVFGEQIIKNFIKVPYIFLRIGDVFGYEQKHGNFFKNIENAIKNNLPLKLYGEGLKVRSYVYVEELCHMILFCANNVIKYNGNSFNLCNQQNANLKSIIDYFAEKTKLPIQRFDYNLQKEIDDYRTMKVNLPLEYIYKYDSFWLAIDSYIKQIKKG
jgi:nucleoside-diphosphate-sugar epimerase